MTLKRLGEHSELWAEVSLWGPPEGPTGFSHPVTFWWEHPDILSGVRKSSEKTNWRDPAPTFPAGRLFIFQNAAPSHRHILPQWTPILVSVPSSSGSKCSFQHCVSGSASPIRLVTPEARNNVLRHSVVHSRHSTNEDMKTRVAVSQFINFSHYTVLWQCWW